MEVNYLHSDELDFELFCRGSLIRGTVEAKRSILRGHLQCERMDHRTSHPDVTIDVSQESQICQDKMSILDGMIDKFSSDIRHPDYKRIRTKLLHVKNRINHFPVNNYQVANLKTELMTKLMLLFDKIEQKLVQNNIPISQNLVDLEIPIQSPQSEPVQPHSSPANLSRRVSFAEPTNVDSLLDEPNRVNNNSIGHENISNIPGASNNSVHVENSIYPNFSDNVQQSFQNNRSNLSRIYGIDAVQSSLNISSQNRVSNSGTSGIPNSQNNLYEQPDNLNHNFSFSRNMFYQGQPGFRTSLQNVGENNNANSEYQVNSAFYQNFNNQPPNVNNGGLYGQPTFNPYRAYQVNGNYFNQSLQPESNQANHSDSNLNFKISYINRTNLKFNGVNQSLHSFLERIDEFCYTYSVSKPQILKIAHELFEGDALNWFRANRILFSSWDDVIYALKMVFLPDDFEIDLWNEILVRTQGNDERSVIYVSIMENLFNRLLNPPNELFKMKIILRNLQPYFQYHLSLHNPTGLQELKNLCLIIENAKLRAQKFREPPPCTSNTLAPDLAHRRPISNYRQRTQVNELSQNHQNFYEIEDTLTTHPIVSFPSNLPNINFSREIEQPLSQAPALPPNIIESDNSQLCSLKSMKCRNCNVIGHAYTRCNKPRVIFCYGCGNKNVTKPNCNKCNPKNSNSAVPPSADTV